MLKWIFSFCSKTLLDAMQNIIYRHHVKNNINNNTQMLAALEEHLQLHKCNMSGTCVRYVEFMRLFVR